MMAETTEISWSDATFNPWIGCTKVSEACRNCYAERDNNFRKWNGGTWGPGAPRKVTSEANWRKPLQWNHRAILDGVRRRVFTASLADVFDSEAPVDAQVRLFDLIEECAALDWLVLTKRPENAKAFIEERYGENPPRNLWLGNSVEDQRAADLRIPILLSIRGLAVRFLSLEPLLGHVDLAPWLDPVWWCAKCVRGFELGEAAFTLADNSPALCPTDGCGAELGVSPDWLVSWVITGGESGPNARPSHPDWFRSLRDQCTDAAVPFHFKQWGEWMPFASNRIPMPPEALAEMESLDPNTPTCLVKLDGTVVRPYALADGPGYQMARVGKKRAGRLLDGVEWNEFPEVAHA